ncbi:MAG: hypothetical protein AB1491_06620 [Thermodesulfobacteriota bacterium]
MKFLPEEVIPGAATANQDPGEILNPGRPAGLDQAADPGWAGKDRNGAPGITVTWVNFISPCPRQSLPFVLSFDPDPKEFFADDYLREPCGSLIFL